MKCVIPYTLSESQEAVVWAESRGIGIILQTPREAIYSLGLRYLMEWRNQLPDGNYHHWILDCADRGELAYEAIRQGVTHIRLDADHLALKELQALAAHHHAHIEIGAYEALDLRFSRNIDADLERFFARSKA